MISNAEALNVMSKLRIRGEMLFSFLYENQEIKISAMLIRIITRVGSVF